MLDGQCFDIGHEPVATKPRIRDQDQSSYLIGIPLKYAAQRSVSSRSSLANSSGVLVTIVDPNSAMARRTSGSFPMSAMIAASRSMIGLETPGGANKAFQPTMS